MAFCNFSPHLEEQSTTILLIPRTKRQASSGAFRCSSWPMRFTFAKSFSQNVGYFWPLWPCCVPDLQHADVGVSVKAEQRFLQHCDSAKNHSCLKVKLYMHLILVAVITFSLTNISSLICGWQAMLQVCQSPDIARVVFWWYILIRFVECERWSCQHRFVAPPYMSENENIFRSDGIILTGDTNF